MDAGKFIICMVFVFSLGIVGDRSVEAQNSQTNTKCVTPNGEYGYCINIKRCPKLLSLLPNQRKNSSIYTFLINSKCGDENDFPHYPKVCCLSEDEIYETVSSIKLPSQDTCGRTNVAQQNILGGRKSELGAWPWIAALGYKTIGMPYLEYKWMCGGSLISDRYVLTAAHCAVSLETYRLAVVRLGELNLNPTVADEAKPINVAISRVITHNDYNTVKLINDIALLKLADIVLFNSLIQPICLPILSHQRKNKFVGTQLYNAGWGLRTLDKLGQQYHYPDYLMEVQVPVVNHSLCKQKYDSLKNFMNYDIAIDDTRLCAGAPGRDACKGDSGGPLMWPNNNRYYLAGITSFGYSACNESSIPSVFTRVTSFLEWIVVNINNS